MENWNSQNKPNSVINHISISFQFHLIITTVFIIYSPYFIDLLAFLNFYFYSYLYFCIQFYHLHFPLIDTRIVLLIVDDTYTRHFRKSTYRRTGGQKIWKIFLSFLQWAFSYRIDSKSFKVFGLNIRNNTDQKKLRIWTLVTQWITKENVTFFQKRVANSYLPLHKKWSFPLRISSVNVTKSLMENFILCAVRKNILQLHKRWGLEQLPHWPQTHARQGRILKP